MNESGDNIESRSYPDQTMTFSCECLGGVEWMSTE